MTNETTTLVGLAASILSSVALLPQLIRLIKTKDAKSLSPVWIIILLVGVSCWVVYGMFKHDMLIIVANIFSVIINALTAFFVFKYKRQTS